MLADSAHVDALTERINDALPQTQCTRCGYPSCHDYAVAIVASQVAINRCPPGGAQGIERLSRITLRPAQALDASCGVEGPRRLAFVVEADCIGCTLCIKACPVDCIVGAPKRMHTVIEALCTGCELCIPACPMDCIDLEVVTPGQTGWKAWSPTQAAGARQQFEARRARHSRRQADEAARLAAQTQGKDADSGVGDEANSVLQAVSTPSPKQSLVHAAMQRAQAKRDNRG